MHLYLWGLYIISIHAPREGSDRRAPESHARADYFNPRSPRGERPLSDLFDKRRHTFQSTLPARGATLSHHAMLHRSDYFNPRSPRGERLLIDLIAMIFSTFQSTLPARGATVFVRTADRKQHNFNPRSPRGERPWQGTAGNKPKTFQSTLPARGATHDADSIRVTIKISIHAPREGSDGAPPCQRAAGGAISIHAPREGSDP